MHNSRASGIVRRLSSAYAILIVIALSLIPIFATAYLYIYQDSQLIFHSHSDHELAIVIALIQSGFIAAIAWLCFRHSGEQFSRWLALGFFAFTLIYACHGIFTRISSINIWQFVLYGPVSRLAMVSCFFVGLLTYGKPSLSDENGQRRGRWVVWVSIVLLINAAVYILASTPWAPNAQKILEIIALLIAVVCIVIVWRRKLDSPLMTIFSVSLLFFAQSSFAFLLSLPWNHLWWFAHIIFATGFILLSYGVIRAFLTTQSFALVFSQDDLMEQVQVEKDRAESALVELRSAYSELGSTNDLLQSVLQSASEFSIIATDIHGVITIFNKGSEQMLGYKSEEMVGLQTPVILHSSEEVERRSRELSAEFGKVITGFRVFVAKSEIDGHETNEWTYIHKDGHQLLVSLVVMTIRSAKGEITGYLEIAENITERKRLANLKAEFISTVSHELRTPLTSIIGSLDIVQGGVFGPVSDSISQIIAVAYTNSQRLKLLIDDLLDLEKITAGKLNFEFEYLQLAPIVAQSLESMRPYGGSRRIDLILHPAIESDLLVRVDAIRIQQIFANLISNAIKFSPEDEVVDIFVKKINDNVRIEVSDKGSGIPWAFRANIFQRFSQADGSDSRQQGGSGLGLAITKQLVEHMEGSIGFESEPGHGALFWVEFPLQPSVELESGC
ncbi:ATP-binding protein [uncultured Zhongshania sp.]|uniref:ATP-binding protein n=1 Tax=uncultured Zhongshania sp. TaxID=1642288 RepID=UPI0030D8267E|tara:strand:- start:96 stop:2111 length:2016 start_codon:yes stop_codon:yes gene_type:complete